MLFSIFYLWQVGFFLFILTTIPQHPVLTKPDTFLGSPIFQVPFQETDRTESILSVQIMEACGKASEVAQAPSPEVKRQHRTVNMHILSPLPSAVWDEIWAHLSCLQENDNYKENSCHLTEIPGITDIIPAQHCFSLFLSL